MDILGTFSGVFMVHCVELMLRSFEFAVLLCDCFLFCQNVTCLKYLPGMGITQVRLKT